MSTAVLEMPVASTLIPPLSFPTTSANPKRAVVQKRLDTVYDELFAELKQKYIIFDESPVLSFLRQHSNLFPLLQEGRAAVAVFFGDNPPIQLSFRRDPETGMESLIAWILTDLPSNEAVDRLFEFADAWYIDQSESISDLLSFNLGTL